MDFGRHLDPLGLVFESFLEVILECKFNPTCVCHLSFALYVIVLQMGRIFYIGIHSRRLSCRLGHP